jgi:hypothetical protein
MIFTSPSGSDSVVQVDFLCHRGYPLHKTPSTLPYFFSENLPSNIACAVFPFTIIFHHHIFQNKTRRFHPLHQRETTMIQIEDKALGRFGAAAKVMRGMAGNLISMEVESRSSAVV